MSMRRRWKKGISGIIGAALILGIALDMRPAKKIKETPAVNLEAILEKAADYCRRLESSVLDFVCREEVVEKADKSRDATRSLAPLHDWNWMRGGVGTTTYSFSRPVRNAFLYDYQCVRAKRVVRETRTLIELTARSTTIPTPPS
jgi:hypothetical protein